MQSPIQGKFLEDDGPFGFNETPVAFHEFANPYGNVSVSSTPNGPKYYLDYKATSKEGLQSFLSGATPSSSSQALFMMDVMGDTYHKQVASQFTSMFKAAPPTGSGLPTQYVDSDFEILGNAMADVYVKAHTDYLAKNPGAAPHQAIRAVDTYNFYTGNRTTLAQIAAHPVCENWCQGIQDNVQSGAASKKVVFGGGRYEYKLRELVDVNWGQKWGAVETVSRITTGEHNFVVVNPKGYNVPASPENDHVIRVVDSWQNILPAVYTTAGYKAATGRTVNAVGPSAADCYNRLNQVKQSNLNSVNKALKQQTEVRERYAPLMMGLR